MNKLWSFRGLGLVAIAPVLSLMLSAQTDPLMSIQQALRSQVKLTRTLADRSDIVAPGSIVELHMDGLLMYGIASPLAPSNTYKSGRIIQGVGGFGKMLAITMMAPDDTTASDYPHRKFVEGEKCWVTSINAQKDGISLQLYSDPYDDIRYYANLKIPFPKGALPSPEAAAQLMAMVLTVVPTDAQADQRSQPAAPSAPAPLPAPLPLVAIAPPPPPADTTSFGQPQRLAKIGLKEIFYYKDMKVTFTSGKVSNVE